MSGTRTTVRLGDGPEIEVDLERLKAIGHNSGEADPLSKTGKSELKSFIGRVERLEEDKAAIVSDIKEVLAEAKERGFTPSAIRAIVRQRKEDRAKRESREALIDLYVAAIGGIDAEL